MAADTRYEQELWKSEYKYVCCVDESGCGSLSGDVYAAAVVFPVDFDYARLTPGINDSKKLSATDRERLYPLIKKHALTWAVGTASVAEIDEHNIYWAKFIAARRAIASLSVIPDYILMDGNAKIPEIDIPQTAIVKGDSKSITIAAGSILAKIDRDAHILELAAQVHGDYEWAKNKSYYSPAHVAALKKHGRTQWHRKQFIRKFEIGPGSGEK